MDETVSQRDVDARSSAQSTTRRGRPAAVDHEAIADAVIAEGLDSATFSRVRARLGVGETTMYRYAPNRNALLRIALQKVFSSVEWPSTDASIPWPHILRQWGLCAWDLYERFPGAGAAVAAGVMPPAGITMFTTLTDALVRQGFTVESAFMATDMVLDLAADSTRNTQTFNADDGSQPSARDVLADQLRETAREFPDLVATVDSLISADARLWFERKLDIVIAGVQALAPSPGA